MSSYHAFELCYLATVYGNLLIKKQPMTFYFKPRAGAFNDNLLRVQPDTLPLGSIRIDEVWINGEPYSDFDAAALTVKLPRVADQEPNIRVRILPTEIDGSTPRRSSPGAVRSVVAGKA